VRIQGAPFAVRARIRKLDVYSGHADAAGLVRWAMARRPISGSVLLNHGEPNNVSGLVSRLVEAGIPAAQVMATELDTGYALRAGAPPVAETARAPRIAAEGASHLDWHNARADFLGALEKQLGALTNDAERSALLQRLRNGLNPPL
jgi:metallo-beta-lactamase family protein